MNISHQAAHFVDHVLMSEALRRPVLAAAVGLLGLLWAHARSLAVLDVELLPVEGHADVRQWLLRRALHQIAELGVHVQGRHVVGQDLRLWGPERRGLVRAG